MAIQNFTAAEWSALTDAVVLAEAESENDFTAGTAQRRAALARAYTKARQLAPQEP
jgi:hypothetical protein